MLTGYRGDQLFVLRRVLKLNVKREGVPMKDGRLEQHQGRYGQLIAHKGVEVTPNAGFHRGERGQRLFAVTIDHVERNLGVEDTFRQLLEREQVNRLLMQLVHSAAPVLRRRLQYRDSGARYLADLLRAQHQQRQNDGRGVCDHDRRVGKIDPRSYSQLAFDPGCAQKYARLTFQRVGKVDDVAAGALRYLPGVAGEVFVSG